MEVEASPETAPPRRLWLPNSWLWQIAAVNTLPETAEEVVFATAPVEHVRNLQEGVDIVRLPDENLAVFKKAKGIGNPRAGNERAAYLISKSLEFNIVPTTVIRKQGWSWGVMQQYVEHQTRSPLYNKESPERDEQLAAIAVFDLLTWNWDRHVENLIVNGRKIWGIDHEYSFCFTFGRGFRVVSNIYDKPLPDRVGELLEPLVENPAQQVADLQDRVRPLIGNRRTVAFGMRLKTVAAMLAERGQISRINFDGTLRS